MKTVAALFEAPLEDFVGARNALAKELRAAGQEEEAARVAGLRKPPKALWLVNQLARRAPKDLQALIDATRKIREAQEKGLAGEEVREGMRAQRAALAALTAAAGGAGSALERRIHDTLQSAAMSEPDALREGRVLEELAPAGFEALLGATLQPLRPRPAAAKVAEAKVAAAKDPAASAAERAAAKKEAARLAAHAAALQKAAAKAERAADDAEAAATKLEQTAARAAEAAAKAADLAAAAKSKAAKAREEAGASRKAADAARTATPR